MNVFFYSKLIICMLKAFNNHFGDRSKINITKIRPFCNFNSAKIAKKCGKILSTSVLDNMTCTNQLKNYTK